MYVCMYLWVVIVCTQCTLIIIIYFMSTDKASDVDVVLQFVQCIVLSWAFVTTWGCVPAVKTTVETFLTTSTKFGTCLSKVWGANSWCWPMDTWPECWHRCMEYLWCRCLWCEWIGLYIAMYVGMGGRHIINCPFDQAVWRMRSVDEVTGR